jgi:cellulose synthase/poly-beta-1,6-N-acetylglucosamine synthase-like glycosyltransferase
MSGIAWALGLLAAVVAMVLWVPTTVLLLQVLAARPTRADRADRADRAILPSTAARPPMAVLMPAHNEASGIVAAIESVRRQLAAGDRLLVVADTCSDTTAQLAAAAGAEVVERHDLLRRGKGYALDHGVRHLASRPPTVVIVVDADCEAHPDSLDRLTRACALADRPVQALYLMRSPPDAVLKTRVAELAWTVKNHVRPLGGLRLGAPCQLMGTGMAFPWPVIAAAPLASGHIVEDMQLGLDRAGAGTPPLFGPHALVTRGYPASADATTAQRTRWEHGHLGVIVRHGLPTLWRAIVQRRPALLAMVLDLCVPPLASLVLLLLAMAGVAALVWAIGGSALALLVVTVTMAELALGISIAWWRFGRGIVSPRELLSVPGYVVAKIPIYARLLRSRQMEWVRTKRDGSTK